MTDDTGAAVRLNKPATRIIALYGAFSELLLALDARELLAARTVADAQLPELGHLPAVGTHMRPNAELIVALKPDLVLQLAGRREVLLQTETLRGLGLTVLTFEMDSFEKMFAVLEKLGRLTGRERQAAALLRDWRARLAALRARNAGRKPLRVFYEARYPNLLAAGQASIVNEIIIAAGGENVVSDDKKLARFNEEALIHADPDAYLIQKGPMNPDPQPLTRRAHYRDLRAARAGRVLVVDEDRFARPGPRAVQAAEELEQWLHPSDEREKQ
nr:ABC transporter substrate-binding protein [uncultured Desulfovibrio sp.]